MSVVYSTQTPIIARKQHTFDYPCKRDAYVDVCYACLGLNQRAKSADPALRFLIYRLKIRWVKHLYQKGYCVQAYLRERGVWCLKFKVDGIIFQWHIPDVCLDWHVEEKMTAIPFTNIPGLPMRTFPMEEALALLEWCLHR